MNGNLSGIVSHRPRKQRIRNVPFPPQLDHDPLPLLIRLLAHTRTEANRTHNSIPKLLIDHRLIRIPVVLHDLIQSIDQRLLRRHRHTLPAIGPPRELRGQSRVVDVEEFGQGGDVVGGSAGLAVEDGGDGDFIAAEGGGDGFEGEGFGGFGGEEGRGGGGEGGVGGGL